MLDAKLDALNAQLQPRLGALEAAAASKVDRHQFDRLEASHAASHSATTTALSTLQSEADALVHRLDAVEVCPISPHSEDVHAGAGTANENGGALY